MKILLVEADDALADAVGAALHGPETAIERVSAPAALARPVHADVIVLGAHPSCAPADFCASWRTQYGPDGPLLIATAATPAAAAQLLHAGADHTLTLPPNETFAAQLAAAVNLARRIARPALHADTVFDLLPGPTAVVSRKRRVRQFNPAFVAAMGVGEEDLWHADFCELVQEVDRDGLAGAFAEALAGTHAIHEAEVDQPDGTKRVYRWEITADPGGQHVVVSATDITEERRLRQGVRLLRDAEEAYRTIVEGTSDALWAVDHDVDGRFRATFLNPAFAKLTGFEMERVLGKQPHEFMPPEEAARAVARYREAIMARKPIEYEEAFRDALGARHEVVTQLAPLFDGDGHCYRIIGACRDMTELRRADRAMRESEQLMALIYGSAVVGIAVNDAEGRFIRTNAAFQQITGFPAGELEGEHFDLLFTEARRPLARDRYGRVVRGEHTLNDYVDLDLRRRDGARLIGNWAHARVVGPEGHVLVVTTLTDVTEHRRAERALRESKERFEIISQASSDAIWDWNLEDGDRWWNSGFLRILGYPHDTPIHRIDSWWERIHPDDRTRVDESFSTLFRGTDTEWELEYRLAKADGSWAMVHDRGHVVRNQQGTALRMVGAMNDLTVQREAEAALRRSEERFARAFFSAPVAVSLTSLDEGRFVDVNDAFLDMYGFLREEVIGKTSAELNMWGDREDRTRVLKALRANHGSVREFEGPYRTHAGEDRVCLTSWEIIELDDAPHLLCIATDVTARTRAENALREAEQYLRSVISTAPVMLFAIDLAGRFTLVEGTGLQALERRPDAIGGESAWEYFAATPELIAAIRRSLAGEQVAIEVSLGKVAIEMRISALRGEDGDVTGAICVGADVTARREAEQARQRAEDRFEAIAAHVPVIVWGIDAEGMCTHSRGGALTDRGWAPGAAVGHNLFELFAENEALVANLRRGLAGDEFSATVESLGRWYETVYTPIREGDRVTGLILVWLDVTDRRAAELDRRLMEERLRSVASNAPVILFALDPQGRFLLAEGAGLAHFHASPEAIIGLDAVELFGQSSGQIEDLERALAGEEFSMPREFGGRTWDVHFSSVRGEADNVAYVIGVATDITERRRAEEALLQAQKLESLGVLAGGVAHDFNNLLVGIIGNAGLALLDLPEASPARDAIRAIETAGHRAADLARQMLAYSGKGRFVIEPVDFNALVQEMGQLLRVSMPKNVALHYRLAAGLPTVNADATQLRQVVMNLVVNAADAIGEQDGKITVTTKLVQADQALLANSFLAPGLEPGSYVSLEVRDTGAGMDEETRTRIFDPFFSTKFAGRGLGLAAVLGIVRGHRGAIRVTSRPGGGSGFTLLLPASAGRAAASRPPQVAAAPWAAEGTVLVVDDEHTVRTVTARALKRLGFDVLEAEDGVAGVEVFAENAGAISCVLLDMTMPRMNGDEAFARIQEIRPGTPVILMSGYNEQDAIARFPESGLAGFVQKPFELTTLRDTVRGVISLPSGR